MLFYLLTYLLTLFHQNIYMKHFMKKTQTHTATQVGQRTSLSAARSLYPHAISQFQKTMKKKGGDILQLFCEDRSY